MVVSYPIVKGNFSGTNMYLMLLFLVCFLGLFYKFIKGSFASSVEDNKVMSQFTAVE